MARNSGASGPCAEPGCACATTATPTRIAVLEDEPDITPPHAGAALILEVGADDDAAKRFDLRELAARSKAVGRRIAPAVAESRRALHLRRLDPALGGTRHPIRALPDDLTGDDVDAALASLVQARARPGSCDFAQEDDERAVRPLALSRSP